MEYAIILGLKMESLLNLKSFSELFLVFGGGGVVTFIGYVIKGGWGATYAMLVAIILFFYFKASLPF